MGGCRDKILPAQVMAMTLCGKLTISPAEVHLKKLGWMEKGPDVLRLRCKREPTQSQNRAPSRTFILCDTFHCHICPRVSRTVFENMFERMAVVPTALVTSVLAFEAQHCMEAVIEVHDARWERLNRTQVFIFNPQLACHEHI